METTEMEVFFDQYCQTCKHSGKKETEKPCDQCLEYPVNVNTRKPMYWKEKEKK